MSQTCARKVGSTEPIATVLTARLEPLDLTAATSVTLHITVAGESLTSTATIDADPTSGAVTADIPDGANDAPGAYPMDWHILWNDGSTRKVPDPGSDMFLVDAD